MKILPAILPEHQVKDTNVFEITGIDFAGPLFSVEESKAFVFSPAPFIEPYIWSLLQYYRRKNFLEVLKRFIARRETLSIISIISITFYHFY